MSGHVGSCRVMDFALQAEESCVSLKELKRRGTFQGITERGT